MDSGVNIRQHVCLQIFHACLGLAKQHMGALHGHCSRHIPTPTHLKQQRDAVGKAVDVEARLDVLATHADGSLHNEGMALVHPHRTLQFRYGKQKD